MIIANPIYDVVFKRLMENERVARFFIGTMLGENVVSLQVKPQEFTYDDRLAGLAVFRLDFIAIIATDDGQTKKVLIEIQKAKNEIDLMRFRNYLAEQYKKQDAVDGKEKVLPITTLYILGFRLLNIATACIQVERQYRDLIHEGVVLKERNDFIEKLTHDSYVVQVDRITDRYQSRLDKLLSLFEQAHFVGDGEIIKEYKHEADEEEVAIMAGILHHTGTDPETRKEIEREREAWRSVNAMFEEKEKAFRKTLEQKDEALAEKDEKLAEKEEALAEKDEKLAEQERIIEALRQMQKKA